MKRLWVLAVTIFMLLSFSIIFVKADAPGDYSTCISCTTAGYKWVRESLYCGNEYCTQGCSEWCGCSYIETSSGCPEHCEVKGCSSGYKCCTNTGDCIADASYCDPGSVVNGDCGVCGDDCQSVISSNSKCPAQDTDGEDLMTAGTCSWRYCDSDFKCKVSSSQSDSCVGNNVYELYQDPDEVNLCKGASENNDCDKYDTEWRDTGEERDDPNNKCKIQREQSRKNYYCSGGACEYEIETGGVFDRNKDDGTDCGDCRECQGGKCNYLCQGTESSCECVDDACIDCSNHYGTACGYGTCTINEKPSWGCYAESCIYTCSYDSSCAVTTISLKSGLHKGWYKISPPFSEFTYEGTCRFGPNIVSYDFGVLNVPDEMKEGNDVKLDVVSLMEGGYGYSVRARSDCTITFVGKPVEKIEITDELRAKTNGWIMIGVINNQPLSVASLKEMCDIGPNIVDYNYDVIGEEDSLQPGYGYSVRFKEACTIE